MGPAHRSHDRRLELIDAPLPFSLVLLPNRLHDCPVASYTTSVHSLADDEEGNNIMPMNDASDNQVSTIDRKHERLSIFGLPPSLPFSSTNKYWIITRRRRYVLRTAWIRRRDVVSYSHRRLSSCNGVRKYVFTVIGKSATTTVVEYRERTARKTEEWRWSTVV